MGLEQWLDYRDGTEPALDAATIIAGARRRRRRGTMRLATASAGLAVIGVAAAVAFTAGRGADGADDLSFHGGVGMSGTSRGEATPPATWNGRKSQVVTLKIGEHYTMPGTGAAVWFTDEYLCTDALRNGKAPAPDAPKDCAPGRIAAYTGRLSASAHTPYVETEEAEHIPGQPAMFGFLSDSGDGRTPATIKIIDMDYATHDATIVRTADSVGVAFFSDSTQSTKWCGLHMENAYDANGVRVDQAYGWFPKCGP